MLAVDVNLLVYAHRPESDRHEEYKAWLDRARGSREPLGLIDTVLTGFVRVVTHPRVFVEPTPLPVALDFAGGLRRSASVISLAAGPRAWSIFEDLCKVTAVRGNRVPDAYLAAVAMENGARWYSADRGFAAYPGLDWRHPLD